MHVHVLYGAETLNKCYFLWIKDTTQAKKQQPNNTVHIYIVNEILFWEGFFVYMVFLI